MRYMFSYDLMETIRNTNQWMGASAKALASYPALSMVAHPSVSWMAAWGEVTERSFKRMVAKPGWGIRSITCDDGRDHAEPGHGSQSADVRVRGIHRSRHR